MRSTLIIYFLLCGYIAPAQQFGQYNSRTLFDSFENPSQKAFYADSSRKFASNFFIPTITFNAAFVGPAQNSLKYALYRSSYYGKDLTIGEGKVNKLVSNTNNYILTFRIFKDVKFDKELGFAWQIRNDEDLKITNETIALFDDFRLFNQSRYDGLLNNKGYTQSYHQFSVAYRENYNKRLSLGAKASILSGIIYTKLNITNSLLALNRTEDNFTISANGFLQTNYDTKSADPISKKTFYPLFKNPGLALTTSASYQFRDGWFLLGNLKDIGFIKWRKEAFTYPLDFNVTIENASNNNAGRRLTDSLANLNPDGVAGSFNKMINGKAELLLNKDLGAFQPNFLLSKNLFYPGGDIALINNYKIKSYVFTLSTAYNLQKYFQLGGQFMIKSPNLELFLGSDQIFKTYYTTKGALNSGVNIGRGYTGASVYMGFGFKIGKAMEHPANANTIPGIEGVSVDTRERGGRGFFRSIFSGIKNIFRKKNR